jgi:DNA-binding CsgD family transcriptional regulator
MTLPSRQSRQAVATGGSPRLSPRQAEIARLVAEGLTDREIGERLGLAEPTIGNHLGRLFGKLGIHRRAALAALVILGRLTTADRRGEP